MSILTREFVLDAIAAEKRGQIFCIELDDTWEPLGYSQKSNAVRRLKKVLVEGVDFYSDVSKTPSDGRPGDRYVLTIDGYKHLCLIAETQEGRETRQYFIDVERSYRTQFEAQYAAPSHTAPAFTYPAAQLQSIAGYASLSYTKTAIRRDFVVGLHYLERGREMVLTEVCFALAVNGSRSRAGVDLQNCPDIQISIKDAIAHHNAKAANKQNARLGRSECDGQLSFW